MLKSPEMHNGVFVMWSRNTECAFQVITESSNDYHTCYDEWNTQSGQVMQQHAEHRREALNVSCWVSVDSH